MMAAVSNNDNPERPEQGGATPEARKLIQEPKEVNRDGMYGKALNTAHLLCGVANFAEVRKTMRDQKRFCVSAFSMTIVLFLMVGVGLRVPTISAQATQQPIPATRAFDAPGCSASDLSNNTDLARGNPEWKAIIIDPLFPLPNNPPTILEGVVPPPSEQETSTDQAHAEVSEEELPWNHYTHDYTFKVVPDPPYFGLLSSWVNTDGTIGVHGDMEVEWENASLMDEQPEGFQRIWGGAPEFVWPAVGDRVWVEGRWIFDCGHPSSSDTAHVQYSTEIHPPRALVTFRLNHPALDSFPLPRTSAPNFPGPQSYLPVTGLPTTLPPDVPNSGPTNLAVTEADIFVSGNGGAANDLCSLTPYDLPLHGCPHHSGPFIPVNDRNYVFDIYPPGTDYGSLYGFGPPLVNGTIPVTPPVPDASLQWRVEDHSSELPAHACSSDGSPCVPVVPIFCPLDAYTKPPDQTETGCPQSVPAQPTRLRVILPFATTPNANFFAQSILLGWDDVPAPPTTPAVRTFQIALDKFTVLKNLSGESNLTSFPGGDWRVFVNVGGQYRYMSPFFDTDANNGNGIFQFNGGSNVCNGDALTDNGNNDCFQFHNTPWTVSVQDGTAIHVAVGGFAASHTLESDFCRTYIGCDFSDGTGVSLIFYHFERIGTYEFDLVPPDYAPPAVFTTQPVFSKLDCPGSPFPCVTVYDGQYQVGFNVREIPTATPPASTPLGIGTPHFGQFISSATPVVLSSASADAEGFQYRFRAPGGPLPTYPFLPLQPYPVHWTHVDLPAGSQSVPVFLTGGDGPNLLQYSAENFAQLLEPRHTATLVLDNTPPVISIVQPQATTYPHCGALTLSYTVNDGTGSGLASFTPTMDGQTTLPGVANLLNGQQINLLAAMKLGTHVFRVTATDNVNNTGATSVTFTIIVTTDSITCDVTEILAAGCIDNGGIANALTSKLSAAQAAINRGNIQTAINILTALKNQISAQAGKHIATSCALGGVGFNPAAALLLDVQALIDNLRVSAIADPITGYVVNASGGGVADATLNIRDAGGNTVATASTDITGYYFFATTGVLIPGSSYTVVVTGLPAGFSQSTPAVSPAFTWAGTGMMIGNFVLN